MLLAASAGAAVGSDARLVHQGQRAFESRPADLELTPKAPLHTGGEFFLLHTAEYSRYLYACYIICILDIIEKNALKPATPPLRPAGPKPRKDPAPPPPPLLRTRFSPAQLLCRFRKLLPLSLLASWLALSQQSFYERAFTPLVTLWYMVFQRLSDNHHLSHVQNDARQGGADRLSPKGKPLSSRIRSESTGTYSDARQRLPLWLLRQTLSYIATQLGLIFQTPRWFGLRVGLLDGSTFRLRPFGDIPKHFAPHGGGNSKRPPYWCVARVVGIVCLATGAVLDTAVGALKVSEQALCTSMLKAGFWTEWLLVGDRNFGVYSVARSIVSAGGQALLRLTKVRAAKLARSAGLKLRPGLDAHIRWTPTSHDRCPEGITPEPVAGRLLAVRISGPGFRTLTLYLFTTLLDPIQCPAQQLVELYGQRWNIEVDFRYIKTQMDLGFLEAHSTEIARKEWWAGLIAYNLIRWTMASAAAWAKIPLLRLSFCRARDLLVQWLTRYPTQRSTRSWEKLLKRIAKAQQPKRRKRRPSEPRAVRPFHKDVARLYGSRAEARKKLASQQTKSE